MFGSKNKIELGDLVKDKLTGFKGVVECISYWLNSCERITIRPTTLKEGVMKDSYTFDSLQVELVEKNYYSKPQIPKEEKTGGPSIVPVRTKDPI